MKWMIDKSRLPGFVRVETSGKPDLGELISMWDDIVESDFWEPGLTLLIDNRKLMQIPEPEKFTEATIEFFAENKETIGHACIAALSSQRDSFKYARQFQYGRAERLECRYPVIHFRDTGSPVARPLLQGS